MSNHKTRDFMTSLDEAETWITPGWCSPYVPMFQPYRGDLAEALADIDTAALAYRDIIAEQYAKFGRATNNLIRPDPTRAWCECFKTCVEPGEPSLECPHCKTMTEWSNLTGG